jgi:group I intron endonuclease
MACLYILINKLNGKSYVGQTVRTFKSRLRQHLQKSKTSITKINRAIYKYGIECFDCFVFDCSEESLDAFEQSFIEALNSVQNGYNLESGGSFTKHHSRETIDKMRASALKIDRSQRVVSDSTRKKMSENNKGITNPFYGKHHSPDTLAKNREAHIGKIDSEETRKKRSESALKKWDSIPKLDRAKPEEVRRKISESVKLSAKLRKEDKIKL